MKKTLINNKKKNKTEIKKKTKNNNILKGGASEVIPRKYKSTIFCYNDDDDNIDCGVSKKLPYVQITKALIKVEDTDCVYFNASKLSKYNIGFWMNYSNEQELMTRRMCVPNKSFGLIDGNSSFLLSLNMFKEKNTYDIWVIFASSKPIDDKDSVIIQNIYIENSTRSNLYDHDKIKRSDCDSIEMCFILFIDKDSPITTHMGIFRNWKYFGTNNGNKCHKNLSSYLHSFSAKISQLLYKNKKYMITNPVTKMREIFKEALLKYYKNLPLENNIKFKNIVVIGNNKQRKRVRNSIKHKYNSEPENIKKIIDELQTIFLEIETTSLKTRKLDFYEKEKIMDEFFRSDKITKYLIKPDEIKEKNEILNSIKRLNNNEKIKSYNDYKNNPFVELLPSEIDFESPVHYVDDNKWSILNKDTNEFEFVKPDWFSHRHLLNHLPTIIVDINHLGNMHFKEYRLIKEDYHKN